MAITSEIIGKLGGAGVEATPVSGTASNNDTPTLANIEIPAGETWLVSVVGTITNDRETEANWAALEVGSVSAKFNGASGVSIVATKSVTVRLRRNRTLGSDSFTGHVYTVKM